jgi:hypothetical protein
LPERADGASPLDRVFGLRPRAYERFRELYDGLWDAGVDRATLEACRARVQSLLRLEPDPVDRAALDDAQRAAVAFAEQYVLDPHGLRDADFAALHAHMDPPAIATLVLAVAMFDARARFERALEVA